MRKRSMWVAVVALGVSLSACVPPSITIDDNRSSEDGSDRPQKRTLPLPAVGEPMELSLSCPDGLGAKKVYFALYRQALTMKYWCAVPVPSQGNDGAGAPAETLTFRGAMPEVEKGAATKLECTPRRGMKKLRITLGESEYEGSADCVGDE